jgi:hypothetical protein
MEIKITGDPVVDNLKSRREGTDAKLRDLAYQRLQLSRQVEDIDKSIAYLEGAHVADGLTQKDVDLREAMAKAQRDKAEAAKVAEAAAAQASKPDPTVEQPKD